MSIARLTRALALVAALLWALAAARPASARDLPAWFTVTAPGGWSHLDKRSEDIAGNLRMESQLGTSGFRADASMWASAAPPATADAAFLVTWLRTTEPMAEAGAAVRAQLDRMRAIPDTASLSPGQAALDHWQQSVDRGVVHARLSWRHLDNQTQSVVRTAILHTAEGELRQVSAECLRSVGGNDEPWQQCLRALDSLTIALPEARRQPLAAAILPDAADSDAALGTGPRTGTPLVLGVQGPGDQGLRGQDVPPIAVARPEQSGYRVWLYLVGALLVLIGVYIPFRSHVRSRTKAEEDEWEEEDSELHRVVRRAKSHGGLDSAEAKETKENQ
jgi:hypothetical protein